jgi:hypothetical protein
MVKRYLAIQLWLCLGLAGQVHAHASEQGFVLLMPTEIYVRAGAAAVAASIILIAFVSKNWIGALFSPLVLGRLPRLTKAETATSLAMTGVFIALIYVGFFGPRDPTRNLLPLSIWTLWWVGFVVVQGVFGDVWRWVNPWTGLHRLLVRDHPPLLHLPQRLQAWPAVILFLLFQGFAIADIAPSDPIRLATVALGYWVFTFAGMILFGAKPWLTQVECFTVFFRLIAGLAPVQWAKKLMLGTPGWAALRPQKMDVSRAVFCLVMLGSGSFDGLHETFWWLARIGINPLEFPGRSAVIWPSTLGLMAANLALIAVFSAAVWAGLELARSLAAQRPACGFVYVFVAFSIAVVPIAWGYHFAHFLTSFLVQIQYFCLALSDPMATGANLLGLNGAQVTTGFLYTPHIVQALWFTQAGVVVGSHILSVLMAHNIASRSFKTGGQIKWAQVGIGILMIEYTIFGLWLLASPRGV